MPTKPEPTSPAAGAASEESQKWLEVVNGIPLRWDDVAPTEAAVIGRYDPADDLERRAARWSHRLPDHGLGSLARFAAGLAGAEAEAWELDTPHVATRAYEDRRFLLSDRIAHWAVPWLDVAGRCYPEHRESAHAARDALLSIGDALRAAPDLVGEGRVAGVGEDAYGPESDPDTGPTALRSLWSGTVLLNATIASIGGGRSLAATTESARGREDLADYYLIAAARWSGMAARHSGTASLWRSLERRARRTSEALRGPVT